MLVDYLSDPDQLFVYLVDCQVNENEILCGFAWFLGGISGDMEVTDGENNFAIAIPPETQNVATAHVLCSKKRAIAINRIRL